MKASSHLYIILSLYDSTRLYNVLLTVFSFRVLRPEMIDEYGINFQEHLLEMYGRKLWSDDELAEWMESTKRGYLKYDAFKVAFSDIHVE